MKNGKVEILTNDQGNRITPSFVGWDENGERLVGDAAKNQATLYPEQVNVRRAQLKVYKCMLPSRY